MSPTDEASVRSGHGPFGTRGLRLHVAGGCLVSALGATVGCFSLQRAATQRCRPGFCNIVHAWMSEGRRRRTYPASPMFGATACRAVASLSYGRELFHGSCSRVRVSQGWWRFSAPAILATQTVTSGTQLRRSVLGSHRPCSPHLGSMGSLRVLEFLTFCGSRSRSLGFQTHLEPAAHGKTVADTIA